jgi:hypothetical protein
VQNNASDLLTVTNALAFIGVLLDVTGAFLSLQSSTLLQSNMLIADGVLSEVKFGTSDDLQLFCRMVFSHTHVSENFPRPCKINSLGKQMVAEMLDEMRLRSESSNNDYGVERTMSDHTTLTSILSAIEELGKSTRFIICLRFIGHAVGTAILCGILLFLVSVVCLVIVTQPHAVWICAVIASSGILMLPLASWLWMAL